jgi:hypothetical protein
MEIEEVRNQTEGVGSEVEGRRKESKWEEECHEWESTV